MQDLERFMFSFQSLTSDLGTEAGMSQFRRQDLKELLPPWVAWRNGWELDVEGAAVSDADVAPAAVWMPNAMAVYGMLHLLHNLGSEMVEGLQGWDEFYLLVKNCSALLCEPARLEKFTSLFILGSRYEHLLDRFSSPFTKLYEQRWGVVVPKGSETSVPALGPQE